MFGWLRTFRLVIAVAPCFVFALGVAHAGSAYREGRPYRGKAFLGVDDQAIPIPEEERRALGLPEGAKGLLVRHIRAGGSAEDSELRPGDLIIRAEGEAFTKKSPKLPVSYYHPGARAAGETLTLQALRKPKSPNGQTSPITIEVPLYTYPGWKPEEPRTPSNAEMRPDWKGARSIPEELAGRLIDHFGARADYDDLLHRLAISERVPDPIRSPVMRYLHRDPWRSERVIGEMREQLRGLTPADADLRWWTQCAEWALFDFDRESSVGAANMDEQLIEFPRAAAKGWSVARHLDFIESVLERCAQLRERAFRNITDDEIAFLHDNRRLLFDAFSSTIMLSEDDDSERQKTCVRYILAANKVDRRALLAQARQLAEIASPEFVRSLWRASKRSGKPLESRIIASRDTDWGAIRIAGTADHVYRDEDFAALYDLGGDDRYYNNQGSSIRGVLPSAVLVDCAGDDEYQSSEPFRQGCGSFGVGLLVDRDGNDRYVATHFGQGVGLFGVGALIDVRGDDTYRGVDYLQGLGAWGAGALIDLAGEDRYDALFCAQAVGMAGGFGLVLDRGDARDEYYCKGLHRSAYGTRGTFMTFGQGCGVGFRRYASGGFGALIDEGGDDRFDAGDFAQGGGYYYGLGALVNGGDGDDAYLGSRYNQGYSAHQSVGVFIEEGGDDVYQTDHAVASGLSWDESATYFLDAAGDDRYEAGGFSTGASAHNGFTIFIDRAGADSYRDPHPARVGGNAYHLGTSLSFLADFGKEADEYRSDRNRSVVHGAEPPHSIFIDYPGTASQALQDDAWKQLLPSEEASVP